MADILNTTRTTAVLPIGPESRGGQYEVNGDIDWWKVDLAKGVTYGFYTSSYYPNGSAVQGLYDSKGASLNISATNGPTTSYFTYTPTTDAAYYLGVKGNKAPDGNPGYYFVNAQSLDSVDDDIATSGVVSVGGSVKGIIDANDRFSGAEDADWYKVTLLAGQTYKITLNGGTKAGELVDPVLAGIYTSTGVFVAGTRNDNASATTKNSEVILLRPKRVITSSRQRRSKPALATIARSDPTPSPFRRPTS